LEPAKELTSSNIIGYTGRMAATGDADRPGPWRERLRNAGLRVTAPRLAVLAVLAEAGPHADADALAAAARARLGGALSTQAVYDNLHALAAAGLLRRIEPAGHPARYELRVGDNHHHLICRRCGAIEDVDCAVGAAPCLRPSEDRGFALDQAEVTFWGVCPRCQNTEPREGSGS
jgi:Fur family ferric uptake transcriptional regulator